MKPKEYNDDIRQYPWLSLENRDDVYYKRMHNSQQEQQFYDSRAKDYQPAKGPVDIVAGKHTYGVGSKINPNPERIRENPRESYCNPRESKRIASES